MDGWLDSLSEDWVSQPRSHHSSSIVRESLSSSQCGPQSRIPRFKPRSISSSSLANAKDPLRSSSAPSTGDQAKILKDITPASINASQKRPSSRQVKPQSSSSVPKTKAGRQASTSSLPQLHQDTVHIKPSPSKARDACTTPEWKKRMLNGKIGANDQTDLFSPIKLEGVFKPPTIASKSQRRPSVRRQAHEPSNASIKSPEDTGSGPASKLRSRVMDRAEETSVSHTKSRQTEVSLSGNAKEAEGNDANTPDPTKTNRSRRSSANDMENGSEKSEAAGSLDQSRNENISPFFISKTNTVDGRVDYAAIDTSMRRLNENMDKLRLQQRNPPLPSSRSSDHERDYKDRRRSDRSILHDQGDGITSQSLPDDLSVGTDAFVANGGFVSVRRGGYSNEGSFQRRALSSSSSDDLDDSRLQSQGQKKANESRSFSLEHAVSSSRRPLDTPKTPETNILHRTSSQERPRSSGSPLKLFDKYDTFTNDRLARRMSKFEETLQQELREEPDEDDELPLSPSPNSKANNMPRASNHCAGRRISSFGDRDLEDCSFSYQVNEPALPQLSSWNRHDLSHEERPFHQHSKSSGNASNRTKRKGEQLHCHLRRSCGSVKAVAAIEDDEHNARPPAQQATEHTIHGKRLPYSPAKDPARKRRRTLRSADESGQDPLDGPILTPEIPAKSLLGRKRKDALYDNETKAADPRVIATRQILLPRAPTMHQPGTCTPGIALNKADDSEKVPIESMVDGLATNGDHDTASKLDPPTQIVAGALATIALNTVQEMADGSRKASVTTADFFNEAQQIMKLIRAEKRPRSSHNSAEDSEVGPPTIMEESMVVDSTRDELSRPPSREGGSVRKLQVPVQTDARVVSHLRKFEDHDDLGLALSSSFRSLRVDRGREMAEDGKDDEWVVAEIENNDQRNPTNIRILERDIQEQKNECSASSHDQHYHNNHSKTQSVGSEGSSGRTGQSLPTGSSRSSGNKMVIAPETVAHLLSDQMAGMVFDRQKQMWVRRKGSVNTEEPKSTDHAINEGTEDDLFGDIPDLSVDEMEELKRVKEAVCSGDTLGSSQGQVSHHDHVASNLSSEESRKPTSHDDVRPVTADGKSTFPVDDSSAPSKYSQFASSGPAPGTRATSWGDEVWPQKPTSAANQPELGRNSDLSNTDDVEHEISILEGRVSQHSTQQKHRHHQPRVVTVAFSSPLVDQIQSPDHQNEDWEGQSELRLDESPTRQISQVHASTRRRIPSGFGPRPGHRNASRRLSMSNQSHIARPMSRLDEQEEMSLVHYSVKREKGSLEVAISTPLPMSRSLLLPPSAINQKSSGDLRLSPMSEFTVHQIDRPVEVERGMVTTQHHSVPSHDFDRALSLTGQEMVKHLTDIEPFEPYWDTICQIKLCDRGINSLHMLNEFCGHVEKLFVSNNQIRELTGIPSTVRHLDIRANCLSDLTAWHHLPNLQYLDVSGNNLQNLTGFRGLVHLRALNADDNNIESLSGIEPLDGLLHLSLRNNGLTAIDFDGFNLERLTKLDLSSNRIVKIYCIHRLSALQSCKLGNNNLDSLKFESPLPNLEVLEIFDNNITSLDLLHLPYLKRLNVDRNSISHIKSLHGHKHIQSLSWRDQCSNSGPQYQQSHELRKLYLSSNTFSYFAPTLSFLNLQRLEISSTGLQTLSSDFGLKCPNLRVVNFNYNALRDLRPLLGITHLESLSLAGNRISRLRRTVAVLDRIGKQLVEVDLRSNPLTVGFYTPQTSVREERRMITQKDMHGSEGKDEDYEFKSAKSHLLPPNDKEFDDASRERLDEDTKLRRRVFEMLVVNACKGLERLDGLEIDRRTVAKRDDIWDRLLELGVLKTKALADAA